LVGKGYKMTHELLVFIVIIELHRVNGGPHIELCFAYIYWTPLSILLPLATYMLLQDQVITDKPL
jgi:hypothetical protein